MNEERFDFVVAGSGAGGSAAACRLAEGGARVLVAERGGRARVLADAGEALARHYAQSGFSAATGNCFLPIPTGRVVGGTTQINSGTCMRTPPALLEGWERRVPGFRADPFSGYVDLAWKRLGVRRAPPETMSASSKLFLQGLERLRLSGGHTLDRAESGCTGRGRCAFVCPTGAKRTADTVFLEPAAKRPGFELAESTALESVELPAQEGGRVTVALRGAQGQQRRVSCRALLLASGALDTPYFIRRFRLGPNWRHAGRGLSVHPATEVMAQFDRPLRGWEGVAQGAGYCDPVQPRLRYEGAFIPPELAATALPLEGRRLKTWLDRYDRVAAFGFMVRDSGRGRVHHPIGPGLPVLRYWMEEDDLALMLEGMRFLARVFFAAGAARVLLPLTLPDNLYDSQEDLERADLSAVTPAQLQMMAFHPLGTCGMGRVVNGDLKAGPGVYVCDGSVVPESPGVNPQITIYAFALRLADHLLERAHAG